MRHGSQLKAPSLYVTYKVNELIIKKCEFLITQNVLKVSVKSSDNN